MIIKYKFSKDDIDHNINLLPPILKYKILIYAFRTYWREYVPITAKVPSWMKHHWEVEKELIDSRLKNIHFLHLSFTCIPKEKSWILGCQCDYCVKPKNASKIKRRKMAKKQVRSGGEWFEKATPHHIPKLLLPAPEPFFPIYPVINLPGLKENLYYDPLRESLYEDECVWAIRNPKRKLDFDEDVVNETLFIMSVSPTQNQSDFIFHGGSPVEISPPQPLFIFGSNPHHIHNSHRS